MEMYKKFLENGFLNVDRDLSSRNQQRKTALNITKRYIDDCIDNNKKPVTDENGMTFTPFAIQFKCHDSGTTILCIKDTVVQ